VALLALSPFALQASGFGPTITADQARALPEFCRSGRVPFFFQQTLEILGDWIPEWHPAPT
jgi:hypothetical protein